MTLSCYKFTFFKGIMSYFAFSEAYKSVLTYALVFLYIFRVSRHLHRWFRRVKYSNNFGKSVGKLVFFVSRKPSQDSIISR